MSTITVWTKQNCRILDTLEQTGRYVAQGEFIRTSQEARLMLPSYDWLASHLPGHDRPLGADYPIWLSFQRDATMLPEPGMVILELQLDKAQITPINIAKWGAILNYSYIPTDEADGLRHRKELTDRGLNDAKVFMSHFYPDLKEEIVASWDRLFDENVQLGNDSAYGLIWEVRKEWITSVTP